MRPDEGFLARQGDATAAQVKKDFFESVRPSSLLKRFEKPEEVAAVVTFVASAQGAILNGAGLRAQNRRGRYIRQTFRFSFLVVS